MELRSISTAACKVKDPLYCFLVRKAERRALSPYAKTSRNYGCVDLMKLASVKIENFRAIQELDLALHDQLTVLFGDNAHGKTSVLSAISVGLGVIPRLLPGVTGINFKPTIDRRGWLSPGLLMTTTDGTEWGRGKTFGRTPGLKQLLEKIFNILWNDEKDEPPEELPIVAFYDTDRAALDVPRRRRNFRGEFPRYAALEGALSPRTNFRDFFKWFHAKEDEELREQKERRDFDYRLKELDVVRKAITKMIPGASDPRIKLHPLRFMVTLRAGSEESEHLALDHLSGGYRIMLALAADLARRMAQGNPHLDNPLDTEAIVLIDEVELHLHPLWQQRVLGDLMRTFPNTQFIVSTHSPQVLTTVKAEQIVHLRREDGNVLAEIFSEATLATYGAEAGNVLASVMGVEERPPDNLFKKTLDAYFKLINKGQGESPRALKYRRKLEELSPRDPALDRADIEIRRQQVLKRMESTR